MFAVVALAALLCASLVAEEAEDRAARDAHALLAEMATQVRDALSMNLETRRVLLQGAAAQIAGLPTNDALVMRRILGSTHAQFPEITWLGVADPDGTLTASTEPSLVGRSTSASTWFRQGRLRSYIGDVSALAVADSATPTERGMDIAVPLREGGCLSARLSWAWVEDLVARMQAAFDRSRPVELLLIARDGTLLIAPRGWVGQRASTDMSADGVDLTERGRYIVGTRAQLRLADNLGLGWTAVVRQRADVALGSARTAWRTFFIIVLAAGLASASVAMAITRLLMRRLAALATQAEAVREGGRQFLAVPAGQDEIHRIGSVLSQLVDHLQREKEGLRTLNAELDSRVRERTLRIERMADDSRQVAVTRERLRIARHLHDTLAHSLMELLTQVRLIRKLGPGLGKAELDAELERAESVAASGMAGARAAIVQIRDNGVRDAGLVQAIRDLASRFEVRTGVPTSVALEDDGPWTDDERAEVIFRIVEEALRNIERHAAAGQVCIRLDPSTGGDGGTAFVLEVTDDGIGFDTAAPRSGHFGLHGMQEQAELIGAGLSIQSERGRGTCIGLTVSPTAHSPKSLAGRDEGIDLP